MAKLASDLISKKDKSRTKNLSKENELLDKDEELCVIDPIVLAIQRFLSISLGLMEDSINNSTKVEETFERIK